MNPKRIPYKIFLLSTFLFVLKPVLAQEITTIPVEYEKLIGKSAAKPLTQESIFGEQVDLYSGRLSILQSDVDLPGSNPLRVAISRRYSPRLATDGGREGQFSDWDLDLPYIAGVFANSTGWAVAGAGNEALKRCTRYAAPPDVYGINGRNGGLFSAAEYWQGNSLHLPGLGDGEILVAPSTSPRPAPEWNLLVKGGIVLRCVSALTATSHSGGEGFEVMDPYGSSYRFDHLVSIPDSSLMKSDPAPLPFGKGAAARAASQYQLDRVRVLIYPTHIRDRHGNTVTYTWNASNPRQLDAISSSDGRHISLSWSAGKIASVSDGQRTWSYSYIQAPNGLTLAAVTLPDGSAWRFQLSAFNNAPAAIVSGSSFCDGLSLSDFRLQGSITHPSGASGNFIVSPRNHGRSWVDRECLGGDPTSPGAGAYAYYPREFPTLSLVEKSINGPGLPATGQSWRYDYGPPNYCWSPTGNNLNAIGVCTQSSPVTKTVTITAPDGVITTNIFGNRFLATEGTLVRREIRAPSSTTLHTESYNYASSATGPFPQFIGQSLQPRGDGYLQSQNRPLKDTEIELGGIQFSRRVIAYDHLARPTQISLSNTGTKVQQRPGDTVTLSAPNNSFNGTYTTKWAANAPTFTYRPEELADDGSTAWSAIIVPEEP